MLTILRLRDSNPVERIPVQARQLHSVLKSRRRHRSHPVRRGARRVQTSPLSLSAYLRPPWSPGAGHCIPVIECLGRSCSLRVRYAGRLVQSLRPEARTITRRAEPRDSIAGRIANFADTQLSVRREKTVGHSIENCLRWHRRRVWLPWVRPKFPGLERERK